MGDTDGVKQFVNQYLSQKYQKTPNYSFSQKPAGRARQRFICELRVDGFDYVAIGNSTVKKDSQTNAARDFVAFLLRRKLISENEVPFMKSGPQLEVNKPFAQQNHSEPLPPLFSPSEPPHPSIIPRSNNGPLMDEQKVAEAEECDFTSDIHGGWTLENCKQRLNEYYQATKQQMGNIKYTASGPAHSRSFIAELTVIAKRVGKQLYAREEGSNKQMSSRAVCLSLVRQLFHIGEIEAFTGQRKKKNNSELPVIPISLREEVVEDIGRVLDLFDRRPSDATPPVANAPIDPATGQAAGVNIMRHESMASFVASEQRSQGQSVPWAPPLANWNPWTSCNIDEGPEASMTVDEISFRLAGEQRDRANDPRYADLQAERSQLPVHRYEAEILEAVGNSRVTLIRGETGCGKTTQIPQFILDSYLSAGRGGECCVLVTQPRRICAISLAERVASERNEALGQSVGYCVRFETVFPRPFGAILFCTVGTMVRKMESGLRGISHIIIDEIHERDVNTDFLLVIVRDMVLNNPDIRVVLMSATIDVSMFTNYFGDCRMLDLEGRMHPVTTYYLEDCIQLLDYKPIPLEKERKRRFEDNDGAEGLEDEALANCNKICSPQFPPSVAAAMAMITEKEIPFDMIASLLDWIRSLGIEGAVLIFLPGWNIISMLKKFLQMHPVYGDKRYLILPLHSQVPREEQRLVFRPAPSGCTKIVLSTNIAESSITINDVVFVIDSCLARQKVFNARNNMTSYTTCWASRTNLEQRRGRAGRVRPGYAFHLCSRARFDRLEQHATPEILRTPLHELALLIKLLRLGSVKDFLSQAMQPPPLDAVIEAEFTLRAMMALDRNDELTPLGSILARLPMEPRLGRMSIWATIFELGGAASLLAAQCSLGLDVFYMSPDRSRLSFEQKKFDAFKFSDHLASLNVFQVWSAEKSRRGEAAAEQLCYDLGFNSSSLKMIEDAANQIRNILLSVGFPEQSVSDSAINFGQAYAPRCDKLRFLLTLGLYPNICFHADKRKLLTQEGKPALCHKGSVNCPSLTKPEFTHPFFTFTEKIRTQAVSCKSLTMISPVDVILAGCRTAIWRGKAGEERGVVSLDDWIPFDMEYKTASYLIALRPLLEAILVRICSDPREMLSLSDADTRLLSLVGQLVTDEVYAGQIGDDARNQVMEAGSSGCGGPPSKRFNADFRAPLLKGRSNRRDVGEWDIPSSRPAFRTGYVVHGNDSTAQAPPPLPSPNLPPPQGLYAGLASGRLPPPPPPSSARQPGPRYPWQGGYRPPMRHQHYYNNGYASRPRHGSYGGYHPY